MFKKLRIAIWNWLAAGKMTLIHDTQEYKMSTYTIGGSSGSGVLSINPNGNMSYSTPSPQTSQTMTIKITPANGGTIVQMHAQEYSQGELHIIPDGTDFDRELGKIITMSKLKA